MSHPMRPAHTVNCSTAAARKVSPAPSTTLRPDLERWLASLPIEVVLPLPLTPTTRITVSARLGKSDLRRFLFQHRTRLFGDGFQNLFQTGPHEARNLGSPHHRESSSADRRPCRYGPAARTARRETRRLPNALALEQVSNVGIESLAGLSSGRRAFWQTCRRNSFLGLSRSRHLGSNLAAGRLIGICGAGARLQAVARRCFGRIDWSQNPPIFWNAIKPSKGSHRSRGI